jgi:hypothetical protein
LLWFIGGDPALSMLNHKKGKVYILNIPFDAKSGNFPNHPIFVPVFYNIPLNSLNSEILEHVIGDNKSLVIDRMVNNSREVVKIVNEDNTFEFIPGQRIFGNGIHLQFNNQLRYPGNYIATVNSDSLNIISANYNRKESELEFYSRSSIEDELELIPQNNIKLLDFGDKPVKSVMEELNKGTRLWKLFVIFVLVFLALEVIAVRLFERKSSG